jgi:hypothetical protein
VVADGGSNSTQNNTPSGIEAKIDISIENAKKKAEEQKNDTLCTTNRDLIQRLDETMTKLFGSLMNMTQQQRDWACVQASRFNSLDDTSRKS